MALATAAQATEQNKQLDDPFIDIQEAVKRGYGCRSSIYRRAKAGRVRSCYVRGRRLVALRDLDRLAGLRDGTDEDAIVHDLHEQIVNVLPIISRGHREQLAELLFTDEQKAQLSALLGNQNVILTE